MTGVLVHYDGLYRAVYTDVDSMRRARVSIPDGIPPDGDTPVTIEDPDKGGSVTVNFRVLSAAFHNLEDFVADPDGYVSMLEDELNYEPEEDERWRSSR